MEREGEETENGRGCRDVSMGGLIGFRFSPLGVAGRSSAGLECQALSQRDSNIFPAHGNYFMEHLYSAAECENIFVEYSYSAAEYGNFFAEDEYSAKEYRNFSLEYEYSAADYRNFFAEYLYSAAKYENISMEYSYSAAEQEYFFIECFYSVAEYGNISVEYPYFLKMSSVFRAWKTRLKYGHDTLVVK
jgi:hypothetical protein